MSRSSLSQPVASYIAGVVLMSVLSGALAMWGSPRPEPLVVLLWTTVFLAGECMLFVTPTGKGSVSMAATMHLASLPILGPFGFIPAVWGSRLVAYLMIQRQSWYRAVFNAAQVPLALLASSFAYRCCGGPSGAIHHENAIATMSGFAAASAVYYIINTGMVAGALSLAHERAFLATWRENFGYRVEVVSSMALFLLAPLATMAYQTIGVMGLGLFLVPMFFIRDACRQYTVLEKTQRALIGSERLAAKGEMAASIGHELNNYLAVVNGNLQLLERGQELPAKHRERVLRVLEQVGRMSNLSRGLMNFSHIESQPEPTNLAKLVRETVQLLEPQNRFDRVTFSVDCDERVGIVTVDPAQVQQVLVNLVNNAFDAMDTSTADPKNIAISLAWRSSNGQVELAVRDTGPGVPESNRRRIFEPGFTTKRGGHGFGLSTVYRIVSNHGGSISVEDAPGGGALFRVILRTESKERGLAAA